MSKNNKNQRQNERKRRVRKISGLIYHLGDKIKSYMADLDKDSLAIYKDALEMSILNIQPLIENTVALYGTFESRLTISAAPEANQISVSYNGLVKHHDGEFSLVVVVDLQQEGAVGRSFRPSWLGNHRLPKYTSALEGLAQ